MKPRLSGSLLYISLSFLFLFLSHRIISVSAGLAFFFLAPKKPKNNSRRSGVLEVLCFASQRERAFSSHVGVFYAVSSLFLYSFAVYLAMFLSRWSNPPPRRVSWYWSTPWHKGSRDTERVCAPRILYILSPLTCGLCHYSVSHPLWPTCPSLLYILDANKFQLLSDTRCAWLFILEFL